MNPFKILGLESRSVSNRQIIQAAALALREKKFSASEIAKAQKLLLDPISRSCQEFLWFIDLSDPKKKVLKKIIETSKSLKKDPDEFRLLNVFEQDQDF